MAEYIERSAAIRALTLHDCDSADAKIVIRDIPAADVAPVVHGRWVDNGISGSMLSGCSVCGFSCGAFSFSYCPNCGAKMEEEATDGD